jgi:hypothetical protein
MRQAQPDDDALMEMGTTADRIRLAYDEALGPLLSAGDAFPCRSRVAYGDWLAQTYHYLFHTTRLIALAASRCDAHHGRSGTGRAGFLRFPRIGQRGANVAGMSSSAVRLCWTPEARQKFVESLQNPYRYGFPRHGTRASLMARQSF